MPNEKRFVTTSAPWNEKRFLVDRLGIPKDIEESIPDPIEPEDRNLPGDWKLVGISSTSDGMKGRIFWAWEWFSRPYED